MRGKNSIILENLRVFSIKYGSDLSQLSVSTSNRSASRKGFLKKRRIIIKCQNVLQRLAEINRITT